MVQRSTTHVVSSDTVGAVTLGGLYSDGGVCNCLFPRNPSIYPTPC